MRVVEGPWWEVKKRIEAKTVARSPFVYVAVDNKKTSEGKQYVSCGDAHSHH
jgi:hypothetical protein